LRQQCCKSQGAFATRTWVPRGAPFPVRNEGELRDTKRAKLPASSAQNRIARCTEAGRIANCQRTRGSRRPRNQLVYNRSHTTASPGTIQNVVVGFTKPLPVVVVVAGQPPRRPASQEIRDGMPILGILWAAAQRTSQAIAIESIDALPQNRDEGASRGFHRHHCDS
jgi:hypothetical protein